MNLIAAVDKNWGIGYKGNLLVKIPMDQKAFRLETTGKIIVMGRRTFESLPGGCALPGRLNVVLSRSEDFAPRNAVVKHSVKEVLELLEEYRKKGMEESDFYIIGGEEIYREFLPYCDTAHITKVEYAYQADAYLENLDESIEWEITEESDEQTYFDLEFYFLKYERKAGTQHNYNSEK